MDNSSQSSPAPPPPAASLPSAAEKEMPQGGETRNVRRIVWAIGFHTILFLALAIVFGRVVPNFQRMFKEFEIRLPYVTECLLEAGTIFQQYWPLFVCGFLLVELPITVAVQFLPQRNRWIKYTWHYGILLAGLLLLLFSILVLAMSQGSIIEGLAR